MYFIFDAPDPPADGGFRHGDVLLQQLLLDFNDRTVLHPQVEYRKLLIGEIALPAEAVAFRSGELGLDVQRGVTPFS